MPLLPTPGPSSCSWASRSTQQLLPGRSSATSWRTASGSTTLRFQASRDALRAFAAVMSMNDLCQMTNEMIMFSVKVVKDIASRFLW